MKQIKYLILFIFCSGFAKAQNRDAIIKGEKGHLVIQDNEFERTEAGMWEPFSTHPLMIDAKLIDYNTFNLKSRGKLTVVSKGGRRIKRPRAYSF